MTDNDTTPTSDSFAEKADAVKIPGPVEHMVDLLVPNTPDTIDVQVDYFLEDSIELHVYDETQTSATGEGEPVFTISLPTTEGESAELLRTPDWINEKAFEERRGKPSREPGQPVPKQDD